MVKRKKPRIRVTEIDWGLNYISSDDTELVYFFIKHGAKPYKYDTQEKKNIIPTFYFRGNEVREIYYKYKRLEILKFANNTEDYERRLKRLTL